MVRNSFHTFLCDVDLLIKAADLRSFRKAVHTSGLDPSVASRRIRDFEDEVGVSLFERTSNGAQPTRAGQVFIGQAKTALEILKDATAGAAAAGRAKVGLIRIGLYIFLAEGFLHDLLESFSKENSGVSIELFEADVGGLISRIRKRELDVAFIVQKHEFSDCEVRQLWTERLLLCAPEQNQLARRMEVSWADIQQQHFVVRSTGSGPQIAAELSALFSNLGYPLEIETQDVSRETLMDPVRIGRGVTFANEAALGSPFAGVAMIPIKDYVLDFYGVWKAENDNPAFRRFSSMARKMSTDRDKRQ
ncbi:LysR family transcriptional regulator [Rhizobium sp. CG5]|uniref:LysR substrate-binding domain-containing protein n=1 Tax=Rhizobium sp. CG5 TaxID=2726076 RepID=UPI0020340CA3|nr:LysR family transcriptional regulator [Rhizobium sp. CG5]MCM2476443.1 LysR family transcriptional regulator [Rhizobium sp. CG5]